MLITFTAGDAAFNDRRRATLHLPALATICAITLAHAPLFFHTVYFSVFLCAMTDTQEAPVLRRPRQNSLLQQRHSESSIPFLRLPSYSVP